jgi:cbb3-type cytochrome oxidase maturation protein
MEETIIQFTVALFMSLGALCLFVWGVLSGMFTDVEGIAERMLRAEAKDDEHGK